MNNLTPCQTYTGAHGIRKICLVNSFQVLQEVASGVLGSEGLQGWGGEDAFTQEFTEKEGKNDSPNP